MKRYTMLLCLSIFSCTLKSADARDLERADPDHHTGELEWVGNTLDNWTDFKKHLREENREFVVEIDVSGQHLNGTLEVESTNYCNLTLDNVTVGALTAEGKIPEGAKQLSKISVDCFSRLPKLRWLSATYNAFTHIPASISAGAATLLQVLDLSDNRIKDVPEGTFDECPELKLVLLANNQISELPPGIFSKNPLLFCVDVKGNPMITELFEPTEARKEWGIAESDENPCQIVFCDRPKSQSSTNSAASLEDGKE